MLLVLVEFFTQYIFLESENDIYITENKMFYLLLKKKKSQVVFWVKE